MPEPEARVLARLQQAVDALAALFLAVCGIALLAGYARPAMLDALQTVGSIVWAACLTLASVAALIGVIFRSDRPERRQFIAYGLELAGWGFIALMVLIYTVVNGLQGGSVSGTAALFSLTALLTGYFVRRVVAIGVAKRGADHQ